MIKSKVVLITGCSSGIGRDLAERMSDAGYTVVATARRIETIETVKAELKLPLDVTRNDSIQEVVNRVVQVFGHLDVLINNAGYAIRGAVEELADDAVQSIFDVNVFGVIRMIRAVAPVMRLQKSGWIINISSIAGKFSLPVNGSYSATKFALEALSDAMRLELKPFGIHTVLIEPGSIRTRFEETVNVKSGRLLEDLASPYNLLYRQSNAMNEAMRKNEPGPEAVSRIVLKALAARKPKVRYNAAVPSAVRIMVHLNDRLRDYLFEKAFQNAAH